MVEKLQAEIEKRLEELKKYFDNDDFEGAINNMWTPDAVTIGPDETVKGIPATLEYYKKVWAPGQSKNWIVLQDEIYGSDDYAFVRGTFTCPEMKGKYITVWKKVDGQYKIYNDIFNTHA